MKLDSIFPHCGKNTWMEFLKWFLLSLKAAIIHFTCVTLMRHICTDDIWNAIITSIQDMGEIIALWQKRKTGRAFSRIVASCCKYEWDTSTPLSHPHVILCMRYCAHIPVFTDNFFLKTEAAKITLGCDALHKSYGNSSCPLYLTVSGSLTSRPFHV